MRLNRFVRLWLPVAAWAGLIFYLSGIPSLQSGLAWDYFLRKVAHVFEFAVLTVLLLRASRPTWPHTPRRKLLSWVVGAAILYAISDEIHQKFVPGRGPSPLDVGIDTIGVTLAWWAYTKNMMRLRSKLDG